VSRLRVIQIALWCIVLIALAASALFGSGLLHLPQGSVTVTSVSGETSSPPAIGGPFRLTSHKGETVTNESLKGKPYAVFFGFTHCPDVCPTTLFDLTNLLQELGPDGDKIIPVLITVDPERDPPQVLAEYMLAFDPRILALTGTREEVDVAVKAFKAFARRVPTEGGYTMDHTALIYLMDEKGRFFSTLDRHEDKRAQLAKLRRAIAS
jgi:protein SCO1/2